jgi:release factor glutamine methyltransferase
MTIKELKHSILSRLLPSFDVSEASAVTWRLIKHFTTYNSLYVSLNPHTEVDSEIILSVDEAVNQLLKDKPIQYVLGETVFCGLTFLVNDSVFIPRPETEELTLWIIEENPYAGKIYDICTGSGCIAISLAKYIKTCEVYAVDNSFDALKIAHKNAILNEVVIKFRQYYVLNTNFKHDIKSKFNVIVSNPPYVRDIEKSFMHKRVLDYEPHSALFVKNENPLLFYRIILEFGQTHLTNNGKLYFEINENFGEEMIELYKKYGYDNIRLKQDIHGKDRMICGEMKRKD